ncbi:MAG: hypothetical protein R2746_04710 [Acidimicrobiales bacterium]
MTSEDDLRAGIGIVDDALALADAHRVACGCVRPDQPTAPRHR